MTDITSLFMGALQGIVLLVISPGLVGLLRWLEARLQGRRGATLLQPYRNLFKLMRIPGVRAMTTSWFFAATPLVIFAAYSLLAFMVPVFHGSILIPADFIAVMYILGLARFVFSLAGLDSGAPFGGLGSSRESFIQLLTELGFILVISATFLIGGSTDLILSMTQHWTGSIFGQPQLILLALAVGIIVLFETERIPVDNPVTHLELTMAHKAITLEYAGYDLALIEWAEMIKFMFLLTLLVNLFIPLFPLLPSPVNAELQGIPLALFIYLVRIVIVTAVLAIWESIQPKLRLRSVVMLSLMAVTLSLMAIVYTVFFNGD